MDNRTQAVRIGCCVGGSSAINGMVAVRGTRSEYDGWAELGGEGSTWDWDGVIPYFRKVRFKSSREGRRVKKYANGTGHALYAARGGAGGGL